MTGDSLSKIANRVKPFCECGVLYKRPLLVQFAIGTARNKFAKASASYLALQCNYPGASLVATVHLLPLCIHRRRCSLKQTYCMERKDIGTYFL